MKSGIYIIRNCVGPKFYVGSAVNLDRRLKFHRWSLKRGNHGNPHLQRAWNKYDESAFDFEVYFNCEEKDLIFHEQLTLDAFTARHGRENIYNINPTAGSCLGRKLSEATKIKIGLKSKGRWTGKHHTEETKLKIKLNNIGKNKGKHHSSDARKKMSDFRKGKKFSEEHKKRITESLKRTWALKKIHARKD